MDWPSCGLIGSIPRYHVSTLDFDSIGMSRFQLSGTTAPASTAWPAANRAIFVPFRLSSTATAYKMIVGCGATATGNFDVGIYDWTGNKIVSSGATAKGNSAEVVCNITDTELDPGKYYIALAASSTGNYIGLTPGNVGITKMLGLRQMDTAYTLPATATFATMGSAFIPCVSIAFRSW